MKKKIVFLLPNMQGGGAEKIILNLISYLYESRKYEIVLILYYDNGIKHKDIPNYVKVISINKRISEGLHYFFFKAIKAEKPEFVFSGMIGMNAIVAFISIFFSKKTKFIARETNIVSESNANNFFTNILYKLFFNKNDLIIAQSDDMLNDLVKNFAVKKSGIVKINNPIDINSLNEKANSLVLPSNSKKTLICIGALNRKKGFDLLLDALIFVKEEYCLNIIGEGPEREVLQQQIENNKLSEKVKLLGYIENPYPYLKYADFFVLPSRHEGFPNVLLEATALGVPVLSNNCKGGINEIVIPNVNGLISDVRNKEEFAAIIEDLIKEKYDFDKDQIIESSKRFAKNKILKLYDEAFNNI